MWDFDDYFMMACVNTYVGGDFSSTCARHLGRPRWVFPSFSLEPSSFGLAEFGSFRPSLGKVHLPIPNKLCSCINARRWLWSAWDVRIDESPPLPRTTRISPMIQSSKIRSNHGARIKGSYLDGQVRRLQLRDCHIGDSTINTIIINLIQVTQSNPKTFTLWVVSIPLIQSSV